MQTCWDQAAQVLEAIVCKKKSRKVFSSACRDRNLKNQPNNGPATCTQYVCTLRFRTRRFSVFSPSTKLMASIKLDFPRIKANSLQQAILIKTHAYALPLVLCLAFHKQRIRIVQKPFWSTLWLTHPLLKQNYRI